MKPPPSSKILKVKLQIPPPKWYCGGLRKLETIVSNLCTNLRTHNRQFPQRSSYIGQYMRNHLSLWVNHLDHTKQIMSMSNLVTWGHNQLANDQICLHDYDWFVTRIPKEVEDTKWNQNSPPENTMKRCKATTTQMKIYPHMQIDFDETGGTPGGIRSSRGSFFTIWSGLGSNLLFTES